MSTNPNNLVPITPRVWSDTPTPPRRESLWLAEGKQCHWCHKPTRLCIQPDPDQATIEHIIPRYKGGTNDPENLASSCRLCNSRRSYEDQMGLKDGSLLGIFPVTSNQKKMFGHVSVHPQGKPNYYRHISLTGDEKRAIMGNKSTEDVLREQRDQAQKEITTLRKDIERYEAVVKDQEEKLKSMTLGQLIRKKIADWLMKCADYTRK